MTENVSANPLVSVIIPAFNEEKELPMTLNAVFRALSAVPEWAAASEVIVCDNNSSDITAQIAEDAGAKVVFEPINQIARARNTGAGVAMAPWLIFIDADTHPSPELFIKLASVLNRKGVIAGGGRFSMSGIDPIASVFLLIFSVWSYLFRFPGGGFLFCSSHAFNQVGQFNTSYFAAEEIFLFRELNKYARQNSKKISMIWTPPIKTSPRKLSLYSPAEILKLLWKSATRSKATLTDPKECHLWYDGRR